MVKELHLNVILEKSRENSICFTCAMSEHMNDPTTFYSLSQIFSIEVFRILIKAGCTFKSQKYLNHATKLQGMLIKLMLGEKSG